VSVTRVFIRRPVFTTMLVSCPIVLGIVSYSRIGVDLFPNVDLPIVTVTCTRPGASVEEMETGVTKPLEEAANTVSGIDELKSTTKEGVSSIVVQFLLEKNRDVAAQEVRDKVSTIVAQLPPGTQTPVIDKFDLDASPVLTIAVSGHRSLREVSEIANKRVRESLESLDGVGQVTLAGGHLRAINVYVSAEKLEGHHLSIEQVKEALIAQNLELPGGRVDQGSRELVLRTMGRVKESFQFNDIIVAWHGGQPIRIRDLGHADDSEEEPRSQARLDGANAVTLVVQKQSGTNTIAVISVVKKKLELLRNELPGDVELQVIRDQSIFIEGSIHEVKKHLVLGALLVAATILLFLGDWRTTILAGVAIPVCIVSTFTLMYAMGFTLNNITLLGLVLAVGIVIDDAIVVHENIFRWMEEKGLPAPEAAEGATGEIALAVLATTFSLVVIFLPIAFMSGRVGRFFQSFGITIAFAILISLGVGFSMTPMLCSRFLKLSKHAGGHETGGIYHWLLEKPYMAALRFALRFRWIIVLATVASFVSIIPLFKAIGKDFIPKDDQSEFEVAIKSPEGWTLDRFSHELEIVESRLRQFPAVTHLLTTIGDVSGRVAKGAGDVTAASIYVRIAPLEERIQGPFDKLVLHLPEFVQDLVGTHPLAPALAGVSQFDMMRAARKLMTEFPDLRSAVQLPAAVASGAANADIEFNLLGPDLEQLAGYADTIMRRMRRVPGIVDVDTTLALRKPELRVHVDREKAMDLGVPVQTIASTLEILVGGEIVSSYKDDTVGEQYDVWLRAEKRDRDDPRTVDYLSVPSPTAGLVRVASLASLKEARGPSQIDRFARQRKVTIVCNADGIPLGSIVDRVNEITTAMNLPAGYSVYFTGRAKTLAETAVNFAIAFGLSFLFMYMILAAQFESFVHPVTILLAVPLTIPFALVSLLLLRQALDIYSVFGLFLLFGIVKKNGILQVDYTNVLRSRGDPRDKAVLEANRTRLRPILMTTVMLMAGMVPIALGVGPGTGSRASIAKVIIGGQALSLLLSLLVTPVAYTYFDDLGRLFRRFFPAKS
jgi:HAE1 family hydrophobic/amphiphilic exporter-1